MEQPDKVTDYLENENSKHDVESLVDDALNVKTSLKNNEEKLFFYGIMPASIINRIDRLYESNHSINYSNPTPDSNLLTIGAISCLKTKGEVMYYYDVSIDGHLISDYRGDMRIFEYLDYLYSKTSQEKINDNIGVKCRNYLKTGLI